jgi:hypothetical protein
VIERIVRVAGGFAEAAELDREDVAAMSFEERISGVEPFLSLLGARGVRYVLVGGHAVAGHAEPRFTEDLDVFVEPGGATATVTSK